MLSGFQNLKFDILSSIFKETTNSYKFLFFLSILDNIKEMKGRELSYLDISVGMLQRAWYPYSYFLLSFGKQDQITKILDQFKSDSQDVELNNVKTKIKEFLENNPEKVNSLLRYVPFRFIRPFFSKECRSLSDYKVENVVRELSAKYFDERAPFYKVENQRITINADWFSYFQTHRHILEEWASWHWLQHMQKKNPSIPNLSQKLRPIFTRVSIDPELRKLWARFILQNNPSCIFSGNKLLSGGFDMDHFLPWKFVTHNQMWNLLPINPSVNSSKSDRIPDMGQFLDPFVTYQAEFLFYLHQSLSEKKFDNRTECYVIDLKLKSTDDLFDRDKLLLSYGHTMEPLAKIALNQGFQSFSTTK